MVTDRIKKGEGSSHSRTKNFELGTPEPVQTTDDNRSVVTNPLLPDLIYESNSKFKGGTSQFSGQISLEESGGVEETPLVVGVTVNQSQQLVANVYEEDEEQIGALNGNTDVEDQGSVSEVNGSES